jgi:hypothetical protein
MRELGFDELYEYIRGIIFEYGETPLPRYFVLRLKGLHTGKFMANKNSKSRGSYSYTAIYATFKLKEKYIKQMIKANKFKDEKHKINYIMVMVESDINNVVKMINRKIKTTEIAKVQADKQLKDKTKSKEYKTGHKSEKGKLSDKQKQLW